LAKLENKLVQILYNTVQAVYMEVKFDLLSLKEWKITQNRQKYAQEGSKSQIRQKISKYVTSILSDWAEILREIDYIKVKHNQIASAHLRNMNLGLKCSPKKT
jgi:hypothetical protein